MNIAAFNSSNVFCGNMQKSGFVTKQISQKLVNGDVAKIRYRHDGNKFRSIECYTFNSDNSLTGGKAIGKVPYLDMNDVVAFCDNIHIKSDENIYRNILKTLA